MTVTGNKENEFFHCGRWISRQEILEIQETVELFPKLSLGELSQTISEHLKWYTASGQNKSDACLKLLEKLECRGLLKLPEKRPKKTKTLKRYNNYSSKTHPGNPIIGKLKNLGSIDLECIYDRGKKGPFNEHIERYHYLGYRRPFGCYMRYYFQCDRGILGCAIFGGAAKSISVRDKWIGWNQRQRLNNLGLIINNSRFLVFPWVNVKNLASHILGKIRRQICEDWFERWNYRPVLIETFVDPNKYEGTCYKAANWKYLGMTTGKGLARRGKKYVTAPKKIYIKVLRKNFRKHLCNDNFNWEVQS